MVEQVEAKPTTNEMMLILWLMILNFKPTYQLPKKPNTFRMRHLRVEKSQWWSRWKQSPPFIYQIFYRISGNASFGNGFEFCQPFETPEANGKDKLVPKIIFSKKLVNSCI